MRQSVHWLHALVLVVACWVAFFWRLGEPPIALWDEGRVAVNALEMLKSGRLLVVTYLDKPELWNVKPPLILWLEVASMKLFGVSDFALRLPSALAGVGATLLVYAFTLRVTRSPWASLFAALSLTGTAGFVVQHVSRSAEFDCLLVFFTTAYTFALWRAIEPDEEFPNRWLLAAGAAIGLAVLAKGIAGALPLPGLGLYAIWRGQVWRLVRSPAAWAALAVAVIIPGVFYAAREAVAPGFLAAVWRYEIGGRYAERAGGADWPRYTYFIDLFAFWPVRVWWQTVGSAFPWIWAAPLAVWAGLRSPETAERRAALLCSLAAVTLLAILLGSATRLSWYLAPIYPLVSVIMGIGASRLAAWRRDARWLTPAGAYLSLVACAAGLTVAVAARNSLVVDLSPYMGDTAAGAFAKTLIAEPASSAPLRIISDGHQVLFGRAFSSPEEWYVGVARLAGRDAAVVDSRYKGRPGEILVWCKSISTRPPPPGARVARSPGCLAISPQA